MVRKRYLCGGLYEPKPAFLVVGLTPQINHSFIRESKILLAVIMDLGYLTITKIEIVF